MNRTDRDKRKKAAAISYQAGEGVPRLIASGQGRDAELIIALARSLGIELVRDPALAALLEAGIKPGDFVPVWCWEALAKILAFVLEKEGK